MNYDGLFFDAKNTNKLLSQDYNKLEIVKRPLHITMSTTPKKELYGKTVQIKVIAYGSDGQNNGFQVELPIELQNIYQNKEENGTEITPHITTSMSLGASAKNTKNLEFKKIDYPFFIEATYSNISLQQKENNQKKKLK